PEADMVLLSGKVATVDENFSIQEAVVIKGNKFIYVGSDIKAKKYIGENTRVINLDGKLVLPGLIDAHAHMNSLGNKLANLDISGSESFKDIVDKVAEKVKTLKPGEWILGGRWDQTLWEDKSFPIHDELSKVSPDNPVYLTRVDGNSAFVNKKALEIGGITNDTPDPDGGVIHRKANGEATGVLINKAMNIVKKHFPEENYETMKKKFFMAVGKCNSEGLTGIHEAGASTKEIALYKELIDNGDLDIRIYAMFGEQEVPVLDVDLVPYFKKNRIEEYGDHFLSVKSIKLFFDGALGSRGAAFFDDYTDDPGNKGLLRISPEYITKVSKAALEANMGVNTHCIGVRGNRLCLDAYEIALKDYPGKDHRFRIEHSQIVRQEDIEKFTALGVIPAMQPTHCTSDMRFIEDRIGKERAKLSYAWRSFIDAGHKIPCGSDFPVENVNPLLGIYAAVTRQDLNGYPSGGWNSDQRMTMEEAIKGFTIWAAYGAWQENVLGSVEPGKLADLTILDKDILSIDPKDILNTNVVYTIVAGKIVYSLK
ncbi:amidohydrolase, partial [Bacteroidota bacterium]